MPVRMEIEPINLKPADFPANLLPLLDRELKEALQGPVKETLKREYRKRVSAWRRAPEWVGRFAYERAARGDDPTMTVYPRSTGNHPNARDFYAWTSRGTRGRWIVAKRARRLRYRHYNAHTGPGDIYGRPAGYYGPIKSARVVWNPGIAPRHFEEHIIRKNGWVIRFAVEKAVAKALK